MKPYIPVLLLLAHGLSACTVEAPPIKTIHPGQIRSLAGQWQGWADLPWGRFAVTSAVRNDGSFRLTITALGPSEAPAASERPVVQGRLTVLSDRIEYEMPFSRGIATFHEAEGQRMLKFNGVVNSDYLKGKPVTMEWVQKK